MLSDPGMQNKKMITLSLSELENIVDDYSKTYQPAVLFSYIGLAVTLITLLIAVPDLVWIVAHFIEEKKDKTEMMTMPMAINAVFALRILISASLLLLIINIIRIIAARQMIKKRVANHNSFVLFDFLNRHAGYKFKYTEVYIIARKFKGQIEFLVHKSDQWDSYFLPYTGNKSLNIKERIAHTLGIDQTAIEAIDEAGTETGVVNATSKNGKTLITNFSFYLVTLTIVDSKGYKLVFDFTGAEGKKYTWKNLTEIKTYKDTATNNQAVLSFIDALMLPESRPHPILSNLTPTLPNKTSASQLDLEQKIDIIWNLTGACKEQCFFCATDSYHDSGNVMSYVHGNGNIELSAVNKMIILGNLINSQNLIAEIDFAGGDPLLYPSDQQIIMHAKQFLPGVHIAVSANGESLQKIENNELIVEMFDEYDFTYDYPSKSIHDHRGTHYNLLNFSSAQRVRILGKAINMTIPLLPDNCEMDENTLHSFAADIGLCKPDFITFLKFMPVGRAYEYTGYMLPNEFSKTVLRFKKALIEYGKIPENSIGVHCALRAIGVHSEKNEICTMLNEKIGINRFGDVFSCPWAANLPFERSEQNPFYCGSLLKYGASLESIIKDGKSNFERHNFSRRHCNLDAYIQTNKKS